MGFVALDDILHRGQVFGPGQALPADVDGERLVRLGKACPGDGSCDDCKCDAPAKPRRRAPKPPPSGG